MDQKALQPAPNTGNDATYLFDNKWILVDVVKHDNINNLGQY